MNKQEIPLLSLQVSSLIAWTFAGVMGIHQQETRQAYGHKWMLLIGQNYLE